MFNRKLKRKIAELEQLNLMYEQQSKNEAIKRIKAEQRICELQKIVIDQDEKNKVLINRINGHLELVKLLEVKELSEITIPIMHFEPTFSKWDDGAVSKMRYEEMTILPKVILRKGWIE